MDIAKTIDLLQSQIPGKAKAADTTRDSIISRAKAETAKAETANVAPVETQQTTGEEFSTFLTLLTAQIKNQDPLAPLDSTQFVQQLATFTNLEFQAKSNQSLELIAALLVRQIEILTPTEPSPDGTTSAQI